MKKETIKDREPVWIALSEFYLDTELQDSDFLRIAFTIIRSPYSLEKVEEINKYEVFPVLQSNLLVTAGEWTGFDKEWLVNRVQESLAERTAFRKRCIEGLFLTLKWMQADNWKKLEKVYYELNTKRN
ncbi:hypothetical protein FUAX_04720 [Fulvitalea axinellae]|uniref:DUF7079 domain-containing protein n=1 Tax=Fulvitalea axinellae TaxID=1182444 RepID=A0AAU9D787_9BACT|nr:hypothetical protein FUAX_04720 [Fulvitalea axinellae]